MPLPVLRCPPFDVGAAVGLVHVRDSLAAPPLENGLRRGKQEFSRDNTFSMASEVGGHHLINQQLGTQARWRLILAIEVVS